jgi:predicted RNA-binding protein Jag
MENKYTGKTVDELIKLLEERDTQIEKLESIIYIMKDEQDSMVDQFKSSTNVLIERLKTETEQRTGVRPQTAQLLYGNKSTLGMSNMSKLSSISEKSERKLENEVSCFNCNKKFPESKLKKHMVQCYR